ncbi:hypothetical protein H0H87_003799 [Tephrocybe sp. NHM501043]|nr:hypothetical protein H0H87_003799 [Tephrocybe sp. NHM501043]
MLAETRAELDDFHHASKELEAELENELQRTENAQQELKVKAIRAESERDEWKRELDKIRQENQQAKIQLRDLEMGNDDLERNERAVSSSLADMEAKYSRALEEKILLEHELLEKASLEEDSQRLRDELRDANVEISILKDQLANIAADQASSPPIEPLASQKSQTEFPQISTPSDEDLLSTPPPPDLQLNELSHSSESANSDCSPLQSTPKGPAQAGGQSALLQRAGFHPNKTKIATPPFQPRVTRSTTLPSLYTSSPRTPTTRPAPRQNLASSSSISAIANTTSKSKGVQMVSEMRARVRNLEQKIHTRVPRLRMGSITGKPNSNSTTFAGTTSRTASSASSSSKASTAKTSWDSFAYRRSGESVRSGSDNNQANKAADSSGWVLIMEDSPPPSKEREKRRISASSPSHVPTSFRPTASTAVVSTSSQQPKPLGQKVTPSGMRRPQSRLSAGSLSTTTTSSIPTPTSRPATPTLLPLPSSGLYAHSSTAGTTGLKHSNGLGGPNPYTQAKRSSLGASTAMSPTEGSRERTTTLPPRPASGTPLSSRNFNEGKALPQLPGLHANITMRQAKLPPSANSTSAFVQSRIGRPGGAVSGRRSTEGTSGLKPEIMSRTRSGSTSGSPS